MGELMVQVQSARRTAPQRRLVRPAAVVMSLDFDSCFEAVRVWHHKRIRGGVSQPVAHAQPSTQAHLEQMEQEMTRMNHDVRAVSSVSYSNTFTGTMWS